jgi:hypothetical protein
MLTGAWQLLRPHLVRGRSVRALVLACGGFALAQRFDPIHVLAAAAVLGFFWRADRP